eukprot:161366-Pleurochrysis_carterae.AAC.1
MRKPQNVLSVSNRWWPTVGGAFACEEPRNGEGRTRGRSEDGHVIPVRAALEQALVHRIDDDVVRMAPTVCGAVVYAIRRQTVLNKERGHAIRP